MVNFPLAIPITYYIFEFFFEYFWTNDEVETRRPEVPYLK